MQTDFRDWCARVASLAAAGSLHVGGSTDRSKRKTTVVNCEPGASGPQSLLYLAGLTVLSICSVMRFPAPVIGITILMLRGAAPITQATSSQGEGVAIPSMGILSLF